jgi:hypothetical protein
MAWSVRLIGWGMWRGVRVGISRRHFELPPPRGHFGRSRKTLANCPPGRSPHDFPDLVRCEKCGRVHPPEHEDPEELTDAAEVSDSV